jgi:ribonuclease BN (tRNA processing enzyme)
MRLQFIGSGDAFGSGGRFNTCFHVHGVSGNFLIDCGASSLIAMKRLPIDRNAINLILLTHFHPDHFGGVPFFILDAQLIAKRTRPLMIAGPPGLPHWCDRLFAATFPGDRKLPFELSLREVEIGARNQIGVGSSSKERSFATPATRNGQIRCSTQRAVLISSSASVICSIKSFEHIFLFQRYAKSCLSSVLSAWF